MIDFLIWGLGFLATAMVVVLYAAGRAPEGYEDENGFHFASPHRTGDSAVGVEAPQAASRASAVS